jgi:hypothetical protein
VIAAKRHTDGLASARCDLEPDRNARVARPRLGGCELAATEILRLQRSAGNRVVRSLLARAPTADEKRVEQLGHGAPVPAAKGEHAEHEAEWEQLGPLGKFMAEVTEKELHETNLPKRLSGLFARAWDVYELVEFAKSGDVEHLGAPAASVAEKVADISAEKIEEGSTSRLAWGGRIGGRLFVVAWTTYEAFKLGAWIRGTYDAQERAREIGKKKWRGAMMQHVWLDFMHDLAYEREQRFDLIMGGTAGYGEVPALTKQAAMRSVEMMNEASDDWKEWLHWWHEEARWVAEHHEYLNERDTTIHAADMAQHQMNIEAIVKRLAGHFQRVREFDMDPDNWALTEKQKQILRGSHEIGPWND